MRVRCLSTSIFVFSANVLLHPPLLLFAIALLFVDLCILGLASAAIAARTGRGRHGGGKHAASSNDQITWRCAFLTENGTKH